MSRTAQVPAPNPRFSINGRSFANRLSRRNSIEFVSRENTAQSLQSGNEGSSLKDANSVRPSMVRHLGNKLPIRFGRSRQITQGLPIIQTVTRERRFNPFIILPVELQLEVLENVSHADLLRLNRTCRHLHNLVRYNEPQLVRNIMHDVIPPHLSGLYNRNLAPEKVTLEFLEGLRYRDRVCSKLSLDLSDYIAHEIFRRTSARSRRKFQAGHKLMRDRMTPLISTLFHYFETYRDVIMARQPRSFDDSDVEADTRHELLSTYESKHLLQVIQMYRLLLQGFERCLRPPSYAGTLERTVRGWMRDGPPVEHISMVFIIGGIPVVQRIWAIKGYDQRRKALDDWIETIRPSEPLRGSGKLLGLASIPKLSRGSPSKARKPSLSASNETSIIVVDHRSSEKFPMAPLSAQQLSGILDTLPSADDHYRSGEIVLAHRNAIRSAREIKPPGAFVQVLAGLHDDEGEGVAEDDNNGIDDEDASIHASDGEFDEQNDGPTPQPSAVHPH